MVTKEELKNWVEESIPILKEQGYIEEKKISTIRKILSVIHFLSGIGIFILGITNLFLQKWGMGIIELLLGLLIIYVDSGDN